MNEWISVNDRLPEPRTDVLVHHVTGRIGISWRLSYGVFLFEDCFCEITHWMPLPEPPKDIKTNKEESTNG